MLIAVIIRNLQELEQSYEKSYRADGELLPLLYEAMNNNSDKNFLCIAFNGLSW